MSKLKKKLWFAKNKYKTKKIFAPRGPIFAPRGPIFAPRGHIFAPRGPIYFGHFWGSKIMKNFSFFNF